MAVEIQRIDNTSGGFKAEKINQAEFKGIDLAEFVNRADSIIEASDLILQSNESEDRNRDTLMALYQVATGLNVKAMELLRKPQQEQQRATCSIQTIAEEVGTKQRSIFDMTTALAPEFLLAKAAIRKQFDDLDDKVTTIREFLDEINPSEYSAETQAILVKFISDIDAAATIADETRPMTANIESSVEDVEHALNKAQDAFLDKVQNIKPYEMSKLKNLINFLSNGKFFSEEKKLAEQSKSSVDKCITTKERLMDIIAPKSPGPELIETSEEQQSSVRPS